MNFIGTDHILTTITLAPVLGAVGVLCLPKRNETGIKIVAITASVLSLLLTLQVWWAFDATKGLMFGERFQWVAKDVFNIQYRLGVDGLSVTMLLLRASSTFTSPPLCVSIFCV